MVMFLADGSLGKYVKLTSSKQSSMIIGQSTADCGICPKILNDDLGNLDIELPIYNYAFSLKHSPYGKCYFESIKRKLNSETQNGLYILEVSPFAFSEDKQFIHDTTFFKEEETFPYNVNNPNINPNFEFIIRNFKQIEWIDLLYKKGKPITDKDGFIYTNHFRPLEKTDTTKLKRKLSEYLLKVKKRSHSKSRFIYFLQTIEMLSQHGKVIIVRMPKSSFLIEIENSFHDNFDIKMDSISKEYGSVYLNFGNNLDLFRTTDGNHLYKEDAMSFTKQLADSIKEHLRSVIK